MKKRLQKKLTLTRETVLHLELGHVAGGLTTTPIGTCPRTDPAVCIEGGGGSDTPAALPVSLTDLSDLARPQSGPRAPCLVEVLQTA